jgi:hypothetical protein
MSINIIIKLKYQNKFQNKYQKIKKSRNHFCINKFKDYEIT